MDTAAPAATYENYEKYETYEKFQEAQLDGLATCCGGIWTWRRSWR